MARPDADSCVTCSVRDIEPETNRSLDGLELLFERDLGYGLVGRRYYCGACGRRWVQVERPYAVVLVPDRGSGGPRFWPA